MSNEALVSVIVPVYNVEKYIDECVESVLRQTYNNFELILIDDGSKDNSGYIADEWAERDSRIKVIHKDNGGLSSARNVGLDIANGEYIVFVDSDDYIKDTYLEVLLKRILDEEADISSCKFHNVWKNGSYIETKMPSENTVIKSRTYLERVYLYGVYTVVWNKMYKRSLFDNVRFELGRLNEDAIIIPQLIEKANKVAHSSEVLYCYRRRNSGIMSGEQQERIIDSGIRWVVEEIEKYSQNRDEDLCMLARKLCFNRMLEGYPFVRKAYRKEMRRKLFELRDKLIRYSRFRMIAKVKILLTSYVPWIYGIVYKYKLSKKTDYELFE